MATLIEFLKKHKEIIKYLFFGVATTLVNFVVYSLLVKFFDVNMTVSNTVAWSVAVIFAFITNKIFVFESTNTKFNTLIKEFLLFISSRIFSGIIEILMPTLLYNAGLDFPFFGVKGFAAKLIVSIAVIILNYVFSKILVFRKKS